MTTEERVIAMLHEARKSPTQPWRPRFSNAGDCRRKLVYEAAEAKSGRWPAYQDRPVRWNAASASGTAIGAMFEAAAQRLGAKTQVEVGISVFEDGSDPLVISGTADIVWDDAVWDLKCVGEYAFRMAQRQADEKHLRQVQGYAGALSKPRWALVYLPLAKIGKGEDLPVAIHDGDTPPDASQRIVEVWQDVTKHVTAETLPDRDFEQGKCSRLRCQYLEPCWTEAA